jgi:hypothetical protein
MAVALLFVQHYAQNRVEGSVTAITFRRNSGVKKD